MLEMVVYDPALAAAESVRLAETAFLSVPPPRTFSERAPKFVKAEAEWEAADERFADAVPKSAAGAVAKLRALEVMLRSMPISEDSLEIRHVRSLATFLEDIEDRY